MIKWWLLHVALVTWSVTSKLLLPPALPQRDALVWVPNDRAPKSRDDGLSAGRQLLLEQICILRMVVCAYTSVQWIG